MRLNDSDRGDSVSHGHDPRIRLRQDMNKKYASRHDQFRRAVLARFHVVLDEIDRAGQESIGITRDELNRQANQFMNALEEAFNLADQHITRRDKNPLFWNIREAFVKHEAKGITNEVRYAFQSFMVRHRFSKTLEDNQKKLLDLRFPQEWFPATRELQRTVHVHVGPTNSGKTYNALKALENSKSGVYAGPLRLLATEVYQRLLAKGVPCALLTGEEIRIPTNTDRYFQSCTVEMTPLNTVFDVAVIDEIQMLADADRGNAWSSALLGVQAKEVHVCGEERAVDIVKTMCASTGDKCIIHRYQRLSPLETSDDALGGDLSRLQKGDAIVAFSRLSLHALKRNIEKFTGKRCAIIYGALPPEVRVQQAALFNDPNNDYDFIVASDAIGMGMNLEIRRVIMESVAKFDGSQNRPLTFPEIKQIGGRAGRYRSATNPDGDSSSEAKNNGVVTTMDKADLVNVQEAFTRPVDNIPYAYIQPPTGIVERFASYYPPTTPLSFILMRIKAAAVIGEKYRMSMDESMLGIADTIQDIPLAIHDRLVLCHVPIRLSSSVGVKVLRRLAEIIAHSETGDLLAIKEIPLEYLETDMTDVKQKSQLFLSQMEDLHTALNTYVWLSYRYAGMFRNQALAFHIRGLVEQRIVNLLERLDFTNMDLQSRREAMRKNAEKRKIKMDKMGAIQDQEEPHEPPFDPLGDEQEPANDSVDASKLLESAGTPEVAQTPAEGFEKPREAAESQA